MKTRIAPLGLLLLGLVLFALELPAQAQVRTTQDKDKEFITFAGKAYSTEQLKLFLKSYTFSKEKNAWGRWQQLVTPGTPAQRSPSGGIRPARPGSVSITGKAIPPPVPGLVPIYRYTEPITTVGVIRIYDVDPKVSEAQIKFEGAKGKLIAVVGGGNLSCGPSGWGSFIAAVRLPNAFRYDGRDVPLYDVGTYGLPKTGQTPAPGTNQPPRLPQ
jgi:hypothetical protein